MFHDSRSLSFRSPAGAVTPKTAVTLSVEARYADDCLLLLREEGKAVQEIPMTYQGNDRYACTVQMPDAPTLVWYAFRAHIPEHLR